MKDNVTIILYAIPLTLLIWLGIRFYFNPGEPTPWIPAPTAKVSTGKEERSSETDPEVEYVESAAASKNRLLEEIRDDKNKDNALQDAQLGDSIARAATQKTGKKPPDNPPAEEQDEEKPKTNESKKADANQQKPGKKASEQPKSNKQKTAQQDENDEQVDDNSAEQQQAPANSDSQNDSVEIDHMFKDNSEEENSEVENNGSTKNEASSEQDDSNNQTTVVEQTQTEVDYDSLGEEHGITTNFVSTNDQCENKLEDSTTIVEVQFRVETSSIKGDSLTELAAIIDLYHSCKKSLVVLSHAVAIDSSNKSLQRRRLDEVRYHLQHMRVVKTDISLPE